MIVTVFKVLLLFMIAVSFIYVSGEDKDKDLRTQMTAICIAAIIAFLIAEKFL
ncbi:hypothetical protein HNQ35_002206 [Cerasibacillus quisquiliarum]|uniref:Uncharacterized protein n=1 Tax=Cerasibacillus quisquiliarum TaxID=227865 RepID=A0A511UZ76_9BACI|nr:hypothetical protein [Cerasibacillus quisquiliarum]MBB5146989.1 hypothetical protein [Cerasibacillus quisquiliarum]GEN31940.1 hypothetical protein CQU01_21780 [Cerasibacillus quisquiliarum]